MPAGDRSIGAQQPRFIPTPPIVGNTATQFGSVPPSTPGTKESGFIGTCYGQDKVQLVQIQHFTGTRIQAWTPDGAPIANPVIYGCPHCNGLRGRFALVWKLTGPLPYPNVIRGTIDYSETKDFQTKSEFDYTVEENVASVTSSIRIDTDGKVLQDNSNVRSVNFNPIDLPKKSQVWLKQNGFAGGVGCSLSFEVPQNSILMPVKAFDRNNGTYDVFDIERDPKRPNFVKVYFNGLGTQIEHIDVDAEPIRIPVKFTGVERQSILAQAKEEGS